MLRQAWIAACAAVALQGAMAGTPPSYSETEIGQAEAIRQMAELDKMLVGARATKSPETPHVVRLKHGYQSKRRSLPATPLSLTAIGAKTKPVIHLLGGVSGEESLHNGSGLGRYTEYVGRPRHGSAKENAGFVFDSADLWRSPVRIDLGQVHTSLEAMERMLDLVGYQFATSGRAVNREAVLTLSTPLPQGMRSRAFIAPSLENALQAVAGPGLIVVVDHARRLVSVDMGGRAVRLAVAMRRVRM